MNIMSTCFLKFIVFLSALMFFSCKPHGEMAVLAHVESIMEEHPDSALAILRRTSPMPSKRLKAKHALLHSQALDKCWIELKTDSIIAPAVDFYEFHGTAEEKIMTYHYLGKIYHNAGDYRSAMIYQSRAKKLADDSHSLYWQGMTTSALGFILRKNYDVVEELEVFKEALDYWKEYGDSTHINYAVVDLALAYYSNGDTHEADSLYEIACDQGNYDALLHRASNLVVSKNPDYAAALRCYDAAIVHKVSFSVEDYYDYAMALYHSGDRNRSFSILRQLEDYPVDEHGYYVRYRIFKKELMISEALTALEKFTEKSDSIIRVQLNQSVNKAKSDYNELAADVAKKEKHAMKVWLIVVMLVLVLLFLALYQYMRVKNLSLEVEYNRYKNLFEEVGRKESNIKKLRLSFAEMYKAQFAVLRDIIEKRSAEVADAERVKNEYAKRTQEILSDIRTPEKHGKLESLLNKELDGIMAKLRADYPRLSEDDFLFLMYLIIGFDATTMSVITGGTQNSVRIRKHRVTKYMRQNPTENMDLYDAFILRETKSFHE